MTAGEAVLFAAVLLALLGGWALARFAVRRYQAARSMFDTVIADVPPSVSDTPPPAVVILPGNFTCLYCEENPALPTRVWCAVCAPIVDAIPPEQLEDCVSRHPASKQRKTGGNQ